MNLVQVNSQVDDETLSIFRALLISEFRNPYFAGTDIRVLGAG